MTLTSKLTVTAQNQQDVREIIQKEGNVEKGSYVKIIPTGTPFSASFDILVNDVLYAKYYRSVYDADGYTYTMVKK